MKCKIKKFNKNAVIPIKSTTLAACHDLTITSIENVYNDDNEIHRVICKFGIGITPPKGFKVNLAPRSSFSKYKWVLANSPGQGDEDYTGEYMAIFNAIPVDCYCEVEYDYYNTTNTTYHFEYEPFPYKIGDRAIQMWISEVIPIEWEEVDELPKVNSNRNGGFGSTGN